MVTCMHITEYIIALTYTYVYYHSKKSTQPRDKDKNGPARMAGLHLIQEVFNDSKCQRFSVMLPLSRTLPSLIASVE